MVTPDDLEKLFKDGLPSWITSPYVEKLPRETVKEPEGGIRIAAIIGVIGKSRLYVFYKPTTGQTTGNLTSPMEAVDEMAHLGKHQSMRPLRNGKTAHKTLFGSWGIEGTVEQGTILKVFTGHTDDSSWGAGYYETNPSAQEIMVIHPHEEALWVTGRLVPIKKEEFAEKGLRKFSPKHQEEISPVVRVVS